MNRPVNVIVIVRVYVDSGAQDRVCPQCGAQPPNWCTVADGSVRRVPCVAHLAARRRACEDGMTDLHEIDPARSVDLSDVGLPGYLAATMVGVEGDVCLALAARAAIGDSSVIFDPVAAEAVHDQLGPLPLEYVRRIVASRRAGMHRNDDPAGAA